MTYLSAIKMSFLMAAVMLWNILWAVILGFALSAVVIAFVPKEKMAKILGRPGVKEIGIATFFGSVSSSCSYAAAAMAKSLFQKGAHIVPALAFMLASTNLVIELSTILWVMMGWQFVLAEFVGGLILVFIMSTLMILVAPLEKFKLRDSDMKDHSLHASEDASHVHHHDHDKASPDSPATPKTLVGWTHAGRVFVSEAKMIWKDIALGLVISGFLMVLVPDSFWQSLFLQPKNTGSLELFQILENALVGPLVAVASFVCSVGNIPLAAVLYHGGISFGGALSFIYADLIILPLILIYRKYYGIVAAAWITGIFYISMVLTGIIIEILFHFLGWTPEHSKMMPMTEMHSFQWNYTTWLNLGFLVVGGIFLWLSKRPGPTISEHSCH